MQRATFLPVSPVSLETTPSQHAFSATWDDFSLLTPRPPFWGKPGGADSLGEQAAAKVHLPGLGQKPRKALLTQVQGDELCTARRDSASEEFYRQLSPAELTPLEDRTSALGVLRLGLQTQHGPASIGGLSEWAQDDGAADPTGDIGEKRDSGVAIGQLLSIGTLGHPLTCGQACKYRNRKSGCLLGFNCDKCHLCCWRYQRAKAAQQRQDDLGAPDVTAAAAAPMKAEDAAPPPPEPHEVPRTELRPDEGQPAYVHLSASFCAAAPPGLPPQPAEGQSLGSLVCPTMGSVGHPSACQWPCKYNSKPRGCKHGAACVRCHLCRWTRSLEHAKQSLDHLSTVGLA